MAAAKKKRGAENYLTDQNWDNEDEETVQEAGTFKAASEDVLTTRVFKKAKRRAGAGGGGDEEGGEKKATPFGAFGGFKGFGTASTVSAPASGLTFGKPSTDAPKLTFGSNSDPPAPKLTFGGASNANGASSDPPGPKLTFGSSSEPESNGEAKKPLFGGTTDSTAPSSGFSFKPATTDKPADPPSTNFWSKKPESEENKVDFFASRDKKTPATSTLFGDGEKNSLFGAGSSDVKPASSQFGVGKQDKNEEEKENIKTTSETKSDNKPKSQSDDQNYMERLASLNVSVLNWIKQHVAKNPCIDLTPVFNDYQKYLKELDGKSSGKSDKSKTDVGGGEPKPTSASVFKTPENQATPAPSIAQKKPVSVFASTPISSDATALPSTAPKFSTSMFSPGMFSNLNNKPTATVEPAKLSSAEPATSEASEQEGEPSDKVPEVENKIVEEKDAYHQIKSKLFYKKDGQFKELGVGMLYLKKNPESDKTQLLVRTETAMGRVLLNINLGAGLPKARMGKNNISLVSVPNPPVFQKEGEGDNSLPLNYLIRVKGAPEADELFEKIKEADDK